MKNSISNLWTTCPRISRAFKRTTLSFSQSRLLLQLLARQGSHPLGTMFRKPRPETRQDPISWAQRRRKGTTLPSTRQRTLSTTTGPQFSTESARQWPPFKIKCMPRLLRILTKTANSKWGTKITGRRLNTWETPQRVLLEMVMTILIPIWARWCNRIGFKLEERSRWGPTPISRCRNCHRPGLCRTHRTSFLRRETKPILGLSRNLTRLLTPTLVQNVTRTTSLWIT